MGEHLTTKTLRRQALFWLGAIVVFGIFLFIFRSVLLPFLAGFVLAYFLDPVADYLERKGMSRVWATVTILLVFLIVFLLALAIIVPVLASQAIDFAGNLPSYLTRLREVISSAKIDISWLNTFFGIDTSALNFGFDMQKITDSFDSYLEEGFGVVKTVVQGIWNSGQAAMSIVSLLVVAPVVAFYMLLDWDKMIAKIDGWIPRDHVSTVRVIARDMNEAVAGFIRGQGTVSLILGIFYAISLTIAGLNFGLLIGLLTGVLSFIPYVGSAIGLILSIGVALVQFWPDYIQIGIIAAIFFAGQFFEGNFLQPKMVGDSVGLHPVWLMFALFAFGSLFGFTGMLIAVPAAAAVGVLVRFALSAYLNSDLYRTENTSGAIETKAETEE
ncbi:AI-2E family transporter [Ahrensia marina]|jgi:predicted PurR-regulated permease PerM|uniref:Membrane protein n=1 Tax=Ahrensia marina TaxID=1514904 RepID=A0A0M9GP82_9HYPH|nr:AI-2E family transporter [Ahrensia marina]KPB02430.1 membrane protein [Ahrensia marina]